jgi:hypothetical protein
MDISYTRVAYLAPPSGGATYLVMATGWVFDDFSNQQAHCQLVDHSVLTNGNTVLQDMQVGSQSGYGASSSMSAVASLPNFNGFQVLCATDDKNSNAAVQSVNLTAIPVNAVN